ncbi:hypothetical protein Efla_005863 [Eimeria flavescens]
MSTTTNSGLPSCNDTEELVDSDVFEKLLSVTCFVVETGRQAFARWKEVSRVHSLAFCRVVCCVAIVPSAGSEVYDEEGIEAVCEEGRERGFAELEEERAPSERGRDTEDEEDDHEYEDDDDDDDEEVISEDADEDGTPVERDDSLQLEEEEHQQRRRQLEEQRKRSRDLADPGNGAETAGSEYVSEDEEDAVVDLEPADVDDDPGQQVQVAENGDDAETAEGERELEEEEEAVDTHERETDVRGPVAKRART